MRPIYSLSINKIQLKVQFTSKIILSLYHYHIEGATEDLRMVTERQNQTWLPGYAFPIFIIYS